MKAVILILLLCFSPALYSQDLSVAEGVLIFKVKESNSSIGQDAVEVVLQSLRLPNASQSSLRADPIWTAQHQQSFERNASKKAQPSLLHQPQLQEDRNASISRIYTLTLPANFSRHEALSRIKKSGAVEWVEEKQMHTAHVVPNDPLIGTSFSSQNYLDFHKLFQAWDVSQGSTDVVIAIIDSGIDYTHPDLANKQWINLSEIPNNNMDDDSNGFIDDVIGWDFWQAGSIANPIQDNNPIGEFFVHGTHVAGIAAAETNNNMGMAGIGYNCRVMNLKAGGTEALPRSVGFGFEAILYAVANGADIINCSWGGSRFSAFENEVVQFATDSGVLIIASAGNNGGSLAETDAIYPASYPQVLSVGSVNHFGGLINQRSSFTSIGTSVDVMASGSNILSTVFNNEYALLSGTSMSAPVASGIAGLLKALKPTWGPSRMRQQLRATSDPLAIQNPSEANLVGKGKLNAQAALTRTTPGIEVTTYSYQTESQTLRVRVVNQNAPTSNSLSFQLESLNGGVVITNPLQSRSQLGTGESAELTFRVALTNSITPQRELKLTFSDLTSGYSDAAFLRISYSNWVPLATLASTPQVMSLSGEKVIWVVGDKGFVARSLDGGASFQTCAAPSEKNFFAVAGIDSFTALVGEAQNEDQNAIEARLFKTTDGGATWQVVFQGASGTWWNGIVMTSETEGYAMSDAPSGNSRFLIVKTTDAGASWTVLPNAPLTNGDFGWSRSLFALNSETLWFGGGTNGKVYTTTDGGNQWLVESTGAGYVGGIFFNDAEHGVRVSDQSPQLLLKKNGQAWATIALTPSPNQLETATGIRDSKRFWVAGNDAVYSSTNNGSTWRVSSPQLNGKEQLIHLAALKKDRWAICYALTNGGRLFSETTDIISGQQISDVPTYLELSQNFPNPFNPITTIGYRVLQPGTVVLKLYDMLGREVKSLVNEFKEPSSYQVTLDASSLSSGMYFYRLQMGGASATKKMIVVK